MELIGQNLKKDKKMKNKETSLSDERIFNRDIDNWKEEFYVYPEDKLKEAVLKLKKAVPCSMPDDEYDNFINRINQIFGEKLI